MALTKNYTLNVHEKDVVFEDVYIKVTSTFATKDTVSVAVEIKAGKEGPAIESRSSFFNHDLNGENVIKQAYEHLKTLPEFADAVDC